MRRKSLLTAVLLPPAALCAALAGCTDQHHVGEMNSSVTVSDPADAGTTAQCASDLPSDPGQVTITGFRPGVTTRTVTGAHCGPGQLCDETITFGRLAEYPNPYPANTTRYTITVNVAGRMPGT